MAGKKQFQSIRGAYMLITWPQVLKILEYSNGNYFVNGESDFDEVVDWLSDCALSFYINDEPTSKALEIEKLMDEVIWQNKSGRTI